MKKLSVKKRPGTLELNMQLPTEGPGRDDMGQLYAWSFDDAWAAQEEWHTSGVSGRGPFIRWLGAQELKGLYDVYRTGNVKAIIEALFVCSLNSLPIPRWCEMAFLASYRKVRHYKAKSWDEVFGRPHPKGVHLDYKRMERDKSLFVYKRIREVNEKGLFGRREEKIDWGIKVHGQYYNPSAIGEKLFERVGKEFDISKTLAGEYYYNWKNKLKKRKP